MPSVTSMPINLNPHLTPTQCTLVLKIPKCPVSFEQYHILLQLRYLFWFLWIIIPHLQHKSHCPLDRPQVALSLLTLIILRHVSYLLHSTSIPNSYKQVLNSLEFKVIFPITVETCLPEFPRDPSNVWSFFHQCSSSNSLLLFPFHDRVPGYL